MVTNGHPIEIHVYSKAGCGICEAAKEKIKAMGFSYHEHSLAYHTSPHEGWREDGSVDAMAAHALLDKLPLIRVGGEFHDYPAAMRKLKMLQSEREALAI